MIGRTGHGREGGGRKEDRLDKYTRERDEVMREQSGFELGGFEELRLGQGGSLRRGT